MARHGSIFDELHKRRRPRAPTRPAYYDCERHGLTLIDAWYSTAIGSRSLNNPLPSSTMQGMPQFEPAFIGPRGQYHPVYRVATAASPFSHAAVRRWQLLDEVIRHAMSQGSAPAWQQAQLVIYDRAADHATSTLLDEWLSHWPSADRPQGGVTLTSLPFFEWLSQWLSQTKDTHCCVCFVALEAADPAADVLSPGESATVLWLQRWLVDEARPAQGVELTVPVFSDAPLNTEAITALLARAPASEALVWDGHDPRQLKPLLKALARNEALRGVVDDAFWSLHRLTGQLHHVDALQVALAAHAALMHSRGVLALKTHDSTRSGYVHLKPATVSCG